ncbi:hypothetical protein C0Q70_14133 [Pomacea canaliculata]|uniref:Uncharacterized protein n=1 Tax=Pomacea canaliculata TaxID=400727 RepID=A0A2T7NZ89_POMCA|nr:hypothetical protein C0Q70_14133 [Pomacea canaliculata]
MSVVLSFTSLHDNHLIDDFESRNERLETERHRLQQERSLILSRIAHHTKLCSSCPKRLTPSEVMVEKDISQGCIPLSKRTEVEGRGKDVAARASDTAAESVEVTSALAGCSRDLQKGWCTVAVSPDANAGDGNEKNRPEESENRVRLADDVTGSGGICLLIRNLGADSTQQTIVLNIPATVVTLSEQADSPTLQDPSQHPSQQPTQQPTQQPLFKEVPRQTDPEHSVCFQPQPCVQPNSGQADPKVPQHDSKIRGFQLGKVSCQIVDGKVCLPETVALLQSKLCDVSGGSHPTCGPIITGLVPPLSPGLWRHDPTTATAAHDLCWQASPATSSHVVTSGRNRGRVFTGGQVPVVMDCSPARCPVQPASYKSKGKNSAGSKHHGGVCATSAPGSSKRSRVSRDAERAEGARVRKRKSADSGVRRQLRRCCVTGGVRGRAPKTEAGHVTPQEHRILSLTSESLTPNPLEERYKSKMAGAEAAPSHYQPGKESHTDGSQIQIENERRMQNIKHDKRFQQFLGSIFNTLGSSSSGTSSNLDVTPSTQTRPEVTGLRSTELRLTAATTGGVEKDDDEGKAISGLEQRLESLLLLHVQAGDGTPADGGAIDDLSTLTLSAQPSNLFSGFQDLLLESQGLFSLGLLGRDAKSRIPSQDFILSPVLSLWKGSSPAAAQGTLSGELQLCPSDWNHHNRTTDPHPETRPCSSGITKDNSSPSLDTNSLVSQLLQCLPSRDLNDLPS